MNFITRNQQVKEELPETYVKYPHLIPFLHEVQNRRDNYMYPFTTYGYFTKAKSDITSHNYGEFIRSTVTVIHYILSYTYNIIGKTGRAGIKYLVFSDTRMGSISMDFSSASTNPLLAKYSIQTKHRMDLDAVMNNIHNQEEVAHIIFSYCNSIIEYAKKKHITNDFVFYNDHTSTYCKVGLDEVDEANYKQVVVFLENYWAKVNTKTGIDIIEKTAPFSNNKVYITQIDYIKA